MKPASSRTDAERKRTKPRTLTLDPTKFDLTKWPYLKSQFEKQVLWEAAQEGRAEDARLAAWWLLKYSFRRIPSWVPERLRSMSYAEARKVALAAIEAKSIRELFGASQYAR